MSLYVECIMKSYLAVGHTECGKVRMSSFYRDERDISSFTAGELLKAKFSEFKFEKVDATLDKTCYIYNDGSMETILHDVKSNEYYTQSRMNEAENHGQCDFY